MSVTIKYVASSGNEYDLKTTGLKLKEANFHNYAWTMDTTEQQYGVKINRFNKSPVTYKTTLAVFGTYDERREQLENLHQDFELDIINMTPGRIYWADDYIDCYIIASSTEPQEHNAWTENEISIYCPYPFWIREYNIEILEVEDTEDLDTDKGYTDTQYAYGYSYSMSGTYTYIIIDDFYGLADYKIVASGPADSVSISINGTPRTVDYPIYEGEYLTIDSRPNIDLDKRIFVTRSDGTTENVFDYRDAGSGIFDKIPPGTITIDYSREYPISLTLYTARSEPRNG